VFIDLGWPDYSSLHTQDYGGLNGGDALVIRITPPAGATSPAGTAGSLNLQEYIGTTAQRYAALTTTPCDFNGTLGYLDSNAIPILFSGSTAVGLNSIQVNRQDFASQIKLVPGTVYYLNLKNTGADGITQNACGAGACNMILNWIKPPGT
jgi:hypothetical protein